MYPSIGQILVILIILLLLFGHKRVREFGKSLGEALRDFKKGMDGEEKKQDSAPPPSTHTSEKEEPSLATRISEEDQSSSNPEHKNN